MLGLLIDKMKTSCILNEVNSVVEARKKQIEDLIDVDFDVKLNENHK